jgi:23S rRNA pseudouridine2605 synthase
MKKPLESERPERADAPSKFSRSTSRYPKKSEESNRPERADKSTRFSRSDSKFTKKPAESNRPERGDAPSKFSRSTSRYPKKSEESDRPERADKSSKISRPASKFTTKPIESERFDKEDAPERISRRSSKQESGFQGEMRLNKYLAHCGIASRRAVDVLIMQGHATVNGVIVQEMGYKVKEGDIVAFKGKDIKPVDKLVYYLLNKPRNVIATSNESS